MIAPKKSLGQHFLQDENIVRKIVDSLDLRKDQVVVEIGPGNGALTKYFVELAGDVVGIEIDARAVGSLQSRFGGKLNVIHSDVLKVDLASLYRTYGKKLRVLGNIPYYITTEILFWLLDRRDQLVDATLMMQHEVAQRLVARPRTKEYGILSIFGQLFSTPRVLFKVKRNSFYPKPNVDSAVVHLDFDRALPPLNMRLFKNIVRSTFGKRRKTLRNGLKELGFQEVALASVQFDLTKRPEMLSLGDFCQLTQLLEPFQTNVKLRW